MEAAIEKKSNRSSNFELMRILAIILILLNHYVVFGLGEMTLPKSDIYVIFSHFIGAFAKVGVSLFILITGYFMVNRNASMKHVVRITIDTVFYSWFFLLIFLFVFPNYTVFTPYKMYMAALPIATGTANWFVQTYLILYLLIPLLNYIFSAISRQQLKVYLILLGILWFLIPTFTYKITYSGSNLVGFIYLYFLGAYIREYGINFFEKTKNIVMTILFSCSAVLGCIIVCNYFHLEHFKFWLHFSNESAIFTLLISIAVFYFFKNLNINYNKYINYFASSTLAVYLIHADMRQELWTKIFHCCDSNSISYLIINILIMIVSIYCFSVIFDKIKNKLFIDRLNQWVCERNFVEDLNRSIFNS